MNWRELKEYCNSLPEDKLDYDVIVQTENEAMTQIKVRGAEEDLYKEPGEDYCYPLSEKDKYAREEDLIKVVSKGDPFIFANF